MVYKDFDIGSAKPNKNILKKYPHQLVDIISPERVYTVSNFIDDAKSIINEAHENKKIPLLVGGSMMYFQSLLKGLDNLPERDEIFRSKMNEVVESEGISELYAQLKIKDPEYAISIKENDSQRIIRALEIIYLTNNTLTAQLGKKANKIFSDQYDLIQCAIFPNDRKILHNRIETRLKQIISEGLVSETRKIIDLYSIKQEHPALKAINYKQALSYINNEYDEDNMYLKALYATRQLAKRQITWMRSWDNMKTFDINEDKKILKFIKNIKEIKSFV